MQETSSCYAVINTVRSIVNVILRFNVCNTVFLPLSHCLIAYRRAVDLELYPLVPNFLNNVVLVTLRLINRNLIKSNSPLGKSCKLSLQARYFSGG